MKQRLGLAQSLLHDPDFLILDEPNNGLDPAGVREMSRIINKLQRNGKTICVSTHILSEVDTLCTHAAILKKGKQIASVELDDEYPKKTDKFPKALRSKFRAARYIYMFQEAERDSEHTLSQLIAELYFASSKINISPKDLSGPFIKIQ